MHPESLRNLLNAVAAGAVSPDKALGQLESLPFEDLGFAKIDHHRALRTGVPEIVYGAGKTVEQTTAIVSQILKREQPALVTRIQEDEAQQVIDGLGAAETEYRRHARLLFVGARPAPVGHGVIAVVSAGTSDQDVFEEAASTAEFLGHEVARIQDVGVAGLHRLLAQRDRLEAAEVVIVIAGMEGALPSVVAGLISRPLIAVPTSVGFGANFGGLSALLCMLNTCAAGVTVVNIDNGFGAAYAACQINRVRR